MISFGQKIQVSFVMKKSIMFVSSLIIILFFSFSCSKKSDVGGNWIIPSNKVLDGGPGKDGIPSVDNPKFQKISDGDYLDSADLIIAIKVDDEIRGYPHRILDWHEIVNDEINGFSFALTYCPLTGTGTAWNRVIDGEETTFGVSGLLYNTNLIPYDRKTNSNWSQILLMSVEGQRVSKKINTYPVLETTWHTFKTLFSDANVMTTETGFARNYGSYPYGDYRTNNANIIFPVDHKDNRVPNKERGLGVIISGEAKFYQFDSFDEEEVVVKHDNFENTELVLFGNKSKNFLIAHQSVLTDSIALQFDVIDGKIMDNEGGEWNLFGEAINGPRTGEKLLSVDNFIGYWFSFGTFYRGLEIYQE